MTTNKDDKWSRTGLSKPQPVGQLQGLGKALPLLAALTVLLQHPSISQPIWCQRCFGQSRLPVHPATQPSGTLSNRHDPIDRIGNGAPLQQNTKCHLGQGESFGGTEVSILETTGLEDKVMGKEIGYFIQKKRLEEEYVLYFNSRLYFCDI